MAWHLTCACATRIAAVRCLPSYLRATWYYGFGEQISTKHAVEKTRGLFYLKCTIETNIFSYIYLVEVKKFDFLENSKTLHPDVRTEARVRMSAPLARAAHVAHSPLHTRGRAVE